MVNNISSLFAESLNELALTDKQKAVLRASLTLFSEKGFENTSTGDIARLAGVGEGTVYKQFKTKNGLLKAILDPVADQVIPQIVTEFVTSVTDGSLPELAVFLERVIRNRLQFVVDNLPQLRVFIREALINAKIEARIKDQANELMNGKMRQVFEYYQKQQQLVDWPAIKVYRFIAGTFFGYVIPTLLMPETKIDVEKMSREAAEFLVRGLTP